MKPETVGDRIARDIAATVAIDIAVYVVSSVWPNITGIALMVALAFYICLDNCLNNRDEVQRDQRETGRDFRP